MEDQGFEQSLALGYELTVEDFLRSTRFYVDHSPAMRRSLADHRTYHMLLLAVAGAAMLIVRDPGGFAVVLGFSFLVVAALDALTWRWRWRRAMLAHTRLRVLESPSTYLGQHALAIGTTGICHDTEYGNSFTRWAGIESIEETDQDLLFNLSSLHGFIVPKSAFGDVHAADEFIDKARRLREAAVGLVTR